MYVKREEVKLLNEIYVELALNDSVDKEILDKLDSVINSQTKRLERRKDYAKVWARKSRNSKRLEDVENIEDLGI